MKDTFSLLLAVGLGTLLPIQVAMNMTLRPWFRDPVVAALPNFIVGIVLLGVYMLVMRSKLPSAASLAGVPWWAWLGGLIGAAYIIVTLQLGPRIGAALLLALILAGQMTASLVVDHFGLLGFPHHPVNLPRLAGAVLLVIGTLLIVKN
jgi:transporter family-2 protein